MTFTRLYNFDSNGGAMLMIITAAEHDENPARSFHLQSEYFVLRKWPFELTPKQSEQLILRVH